MSDLDAQVGLILLASSAAGLVILRARASERGTWMRTGAVAAVAALAALMLGNARLAAIDGGAFRGEPGQPVAASGSVVSVPRRSHGEARVEVETGDGKLLLSAPEPVPELPVGSEVRATGALAAPDPFLAPQLRRHGIAQMLAAEEIEPTGRHRGGVAGALDGVRSRAEGALERGMPAPEAALARGFVLGEDDRIDPRTADDFKRSGLAHLLAVSGQNVVLLALLAMPLLALAGLSLRARLFCVLALIAIYVPVAGAGPSIQRAGAMGAAGLVAALAGRPRSRAYAVLLAVFATLALNPRMCAEIGWQLSFAAVIGILLWTRRLAALLPRGGERGWRRALAEGVAMSIAATVATAPIMAHHFERFSVASLPANLLALPAVAPAMWLGMLSGAAGQLPDPASWALAHPFNAVNQLLLAYIEQVARWFAEPSWAVVSVRLQGPPAVVAAYLALMAAAWLGLRAAERRRGLRAAAGSGKGRRRRPVRFALGLASLLLIWATPVGPFADSPGAEGEELSGNATPVNKLRISILDVGQGDAILLQPPGAAAVLVDGGPPGEDLGRLLAEHGVEELAAAVLTHDQRDHAGGLLELLGRTPVGSLAYAVAGPELLGAAAASATKPLRVFEGSELRSGELRLEVLWPPSTVTASSSDDPNRNSLVILAEWRHFSILLTGDAEAEAATIEAGPVDVLKVAHHGSADMGLPALLDRTVPDLAVISVGDDNPYGHPAPETLAEISEHDLPVLRTDEEGTIEIEAGPSGWAVENAE